ncbi:hypothetical protein VTK73DRAFT_5880 [Phialemonium thermophilum]|uniref:Uncharacterized protein n=1 Tax=Phialemonium thermophilum TaxID=223376 RepID=A0ABR3XWV3_9PEZI
MLLSKKYGVKLAQFTHASGGIIYASTKQNDAIRYLATHDNSFIRYFEGHEDTVNCLAMHPGTDNFISGSQDGTVALWDLSNKQWTAKLLLNNPRLLAWDPSGNVFGVACPSSACVLLYDYRGYTRGPFKTISTVGSPLTDRLGQHVSSGWTKLEFSNDGKHILLGIKGAYHVLFDAFDGDVKALLHKPEGGTKRAAPGEGQYGPDAELLESSGECGFSPDGRYVLSGSKKNVLVWDTLARADHGEVQEPTFVLEEDRETAVLKYNPRYNMLATADRELMFWLPDPHA